MFNFNLCGGSEFETQEGTTRISRVGNYEMALTQNMFIASEHNYWLRNLGV